MVQGWGQAHSKELQDEEEIDQISGLVRRIREMTKVEGMRRSDEAYRSEAALAERYQ